MFEQLRAHFEPIETNWYEKMVDAANKDDFKEIIQIVAQLDSQPEKNPADYYYTLKSILYNNAERAAIDPFRSFVLKQSSAKLNYLFEGMNTSINYSLNKTDTAFLQLNQTTENPDLADYWEIRGEAFIDNRSKILQIRFVENDGNPPLLSPSIIRVLPTPPVPRPSIIEQYEMRIRSQIHF